jgi:hypothetical protein
MEKESIFFNPSPKNILDKKSVSELSLLYGKIIAKRNKVVKKQEILPSGKLAKNIFSALRKAIIREITVGKLEVKSRDGEEKGEQVTRYQTFGCQNWIPDGEYSIVKIEE